MVCTACGVWGNDNPGTVRMIRLLKAASQAVRYQLPQVRQDRLGFCGQLAMTAKT